MTPRTQAFKIARLLLCLCVGGVQIPTHAAALRTPADDEAFSERLKANEEMDFIHQIFEGEARRLTSHSNAQPSPEVAILSDSSTVRRPQLGDTRVPLPIRLVERERLALVSGVEMIKASLQSDCADDQVLDMTKFGDPLVRSREVQRLQCTRIRRESYRRGTHDEGLARCAACGAASPAAVSCPVAGPDPIAQIRGRAAGEG